jgi:hypothetical protein
MFLLIQITIITLIRKVSSTKRLIAQASASRRTITKYARLNIPIAPHNLISILSLFFPAPRHVLYKKHIARADQYVFAIV